MIVMIAKGDVRIGLEWRFGPDWPGQRCGAKTRRGTPCQRPANKKNGRCRLHGGGSKGPKTAEGRAKIAAASMQAAPAIYLPSRALTWGPTAGLGTASLPRPLRPKTPLDTDGHIVFCQH